MGCELQYSGRLDLNEGTGWEGRKPVVLDTGYKCIILKSPPPTVPIPKYFFFPIDGVSVICRYFLFFSAELGEIKGTVSVISSDPPCKEGNGLHWYPINL